MSPHEELLAALAYIRDRTGDPNAWQTGLTPQEVAAVVNPATRSEQLGEILGKVRQQHPDLFDTPMPIARPPDTAAAPPDGEQGAAAEAIARAEAALAQQNTASSQLDMQVITAILNAHLKSVEGGQALTTLQQEIEAAVQTRSDLDTPAGARDFQRLLIGKLRDIRAIVLDASLDDTSKSALMAAWTSLYDASKNGSSGEEERASTVPAETASGDDPDTDWDPMLDAVPLDDPGSTQGPPAAATPTAPAPPSIPGFGAGSIPNLGMPPGSLSSWGLPSLPASQDGTRTDPARRGLDHELARPDEPDPGDGGPAVEHDADHPENASGGNLDSPAGGPTTVTLPDGETVRAASPQLAAAIKAAVGGMPIADAFRQQGMTIPPPGTPVTDPIAPLRLTPGDIGVFTDRYALALSPGKALLDGQIQHISTVSGPSFLGWEHPPGATATAAGPAEPETPAPTRPAAAPTASQRRAAGSPGGA